MRSKLLLLLCASIPWQAIAAQSDGLPLTAARTAKFTTSKGTWLSVDVSPDGRTIVFDLLGDLYTIPITGGKATRLSSGLPYDAMPRWSPDGKRIVFVSDRTGGDNLWTVAPDGSDPRMITPKGNQNWYISPDWTPDGKYIVVSRAGAGFGLPKLWLFDVDGGTGIQLTRAPNPLGYFGAAMGPNPRYIYFGQRVGLWQYNAGMPQFQVGVYDRETGSTTTLTNRYGSGFRPAISPDGNWMVYGSRDNAQTGLRIRNLASGEERWLAYPVQHDNMEAVPDLDVLPGYSFTPDGSSVVVSYGGEIWRVPTSGAPAVKIPFSVDAEVAVGPELKFDYPIEDSPTFTVRHIRSPVPSPDGRRVAFSALDRLYVADLPNGAPRRLTDQEVGEYFPTWSPDGSAIAYVSWDGNDGNVMRVNASGGAPTRVTTVGGLYNTPVWSPDGRRIVVIRSHARNQRESIDPFTFQGQGAQFVWVPATGGAPTAIRPTDGLSDPHFTADTGRIFAYGNTAPPGLGPGTGAALVSFRWDGTDLKQHVRMLGPLPLSFTSRDDERRGDVRPMPDLAREMAQELAGPQEPSVQGSTADVVLMSPRGDWALAAFGNDIYVARVPQIGGAVPIVIVRRPDSAATRALKLSDIGGEFPTWSADGRTIHWSIGNAFVSYDVARGIAVDDSLRRAGADSTVRLRNAYHPGEVRFRVTANRDVPQGTVVLRGARVVTMRANEVIENADVIVRNNRIVSVGPRGSADPAGARVIDVAGKTIVPGFVDTHSHMWPAWGIHWKQPWIYLANLAYGVTTTRDPQTSTTDVLSYQDRVDAGAAIGPRIYSTGPGVFSGDRVGDLDRARSVLKRYSEYYDTKTFKMYMAGNRQTRQYLAMAARELKLMPTTEGGLQFELDMTHAMDGYAGVEHAIPITPMYEDVVQLFKASGTTNTPTILVSYGGPWAEDYYYDTEDVVNDKKLRHFTPAEEFDSKTRRRSPSMGTGWFHKSEHVFYKHGAFAKQMVEGGAHVGVGSHGQLQGLGYHWELWDIQSGGMANHDALRAATLFGARAIGLEKDLGSLEAGKLADLIVLDKNPLENIRNSNTIRYVMKNGRLYDGNTLDELWPRQKPADDEPWRHTAPVATPGTR